LEDPGVGNIKTVLTEIGSTSSGSEQGQAMGSHEHSNKPFNPIKFGGLLE